VIADEREAGSCGDQRAAAARLRPVAHEVTEAPEGVRAFALDVRKDGFEGMEIAVDIGDDRDSHPGRGTLAVLLFGAVALVAALLLLLRTKVPELRLPDVDPSTLFPAAELDRIERFRAVTRWLWVGATAVELIVLALLAWQARPLMVRLERATPALASRRVAMALVLALGASVAVWLARLPVLALRHWWEGRYGLASQGWGGWLVDSAGALAVTTAILLLVVAGFVWLAARFGSKWVLPGGAALAALGVLVVLAQPVAIEPLFSHLRPLQNPGLAEEVSSLGQRLGITVDEVEVADASRRTTAANAYVAGLGPTRRVVLYDTLLDGRFTQPAILSVTAHELAHVARHHVWKGVAWFALFAVAGVVIVGLLVERRGGLADPAMVPLALLLAFVFFLATLPAQTAVSRRYEAEADWLAVSATNDPDGMVALQVELARAGLADPTPPAWSRLFLGTHPTVVERVGMAKAFQAGGYGRGAAVP
jgi:Zn-dependent protease with chaperone function